MRQYSINLYNDKNMPTYIIARTKLLANKILKDSGVQGLQVIGDGIKYDGSYSRCSDEYLYNAQTSIIIKYVKENRLFVKEVN